MSSKVCFFFLGIFADFFLFIISIMAYSLPLTTMLFLLAVVYWLKLTVGLSAFLFLPGFFLTGSSDDEEGDLFFFGIFNSIYLKV